MDPRVRRFNRTHPDHSFEAHAAGVYSTRAVELEGDTMRFLLQWLVEQRGGVAIGLALVLFAVTLLLRYGYDMWWPAGIVLATIFGLIGLFGGGSK
jgi:hypothetical protein